MHYLQGRYSQKFNRRRGRTGALWQSRYQAKLIDEQGYLDRVILYIHLNPIKARLVIDPAEHVFCGHREIAKRTKNPLIDIDDALLCFGQTGRTARRAYLAAVRIGSRGNGDEDIQADRDTKIWLRRDHDLGPNLTGPYIDELGRSTGMERPDVSSEEFVSGCAKLLKESVESLISRSRLPSIVEARRLLVTLGRERWGQSTSGLAAVLCKRPDVVSYLKREGVKRRLEDRGFERQLDELDRLLAADLSMPKR